MHDTRLPYNQEEIPLNTTNHIVYHQNDTLLSKNTVIPFDSMQAQYCTSLTNLDESENQLNRLRILCSAKDRKVSLFQNLCEEYQEKYDSDIRTLKHKLELCEKSRYDWEQGYQSINIQREELIETNQQLHRTIKDSELRIQQTEAIKTQQSESSGHSQQDYELVLSATREKYDQEVISLNEKLRTMEMNLQEKNVEVDEFRIQLEIAYKTNKKTVFDRLETINHFNEQLQDCQRKYNDLLNTSSLESFSLIEIRRQLNCMTEDKDKLESKCQELQSEIRTLRDHVSKDEHEVNNAIFSIRTVPIVASNHSEISPLDEALINENIRLKERIDEFVCNEKHLVELTNQLQHKIQEYEYRLKRSDSSSSSSSNETVITSGIYMEQTRNLTNQIEILKKDYADLEEKYDYEKHELQTMIEQLREDVTDIDKTKQLYIDVCQEKKSIEDTLRSQFEFELKSKLDELHRILEKEYNEKISFYKNNDTFNVQYDSNSEQRLRELNQHIERSKVEHEKQINELNNELDRLRTNDDAQTRLTYTEKEFEQLKHDYYNLNLKQKELLSSSSTLENENEKLLKLIEQNEQEKLRLKQTFENEKETLLKQSKQLTEKPKEELSFLPNTADHNQVNLNEDIESFQLRIEHYENVITQYEEFRDKVENNLQKLSQQRDTYKNDLKSTREMLTNKEEEYNQLKIRFDQYEKQLQKNKERFIEYDTTINNSEKKIKQYETHTGKLDPARSTITQGTDHDYHEKLHAFESEKYQLEQRVQEANRAIDLADSHLQREIEKIKLSLEEEYNRRYEHDQKQHQHDLQQLQQELAKQIEKQRIIISPINLSSSSRQETEELKQMYRTEIDRLHHENTELSQHQGKLIDSHQKQMHIMKKELDEGYHNVISEFQREQTRLQTRYDQLKHQLTEAQQTIELLKSNLNQLKTVRFNDMPNVKAISTNDNRNRQDNLQNRLEKLVMLLEQSNDALNQERIVHTKQEYENQQMISSLQKKIADMIRQHIEAVDEIKHELHQERLTNQRRVIPRPTSVPEFSQTEFIINNVESDHATTIEKLRAILAPYMDNLEVPLKEQIQNELIRSRNSMIKQIRREILKK